MFSTLSNMVSVYHCVMFEHVENKYLSNKKVFYKKQKAKTLIIYKTVFYQNNSGVYFNKNNPVGENCQIIAKRSKRKCWKKTN